MRTACFVLLSAIAANAAAQELPDAAPPPADDNAKTLDTVRVTAPRPEVLDLDRFRNPIEPQPTRFDRSMHGTPSLEEIGMNGGVIPFLIGYVAQKVAVEVKKVPGWKDREQPAIARPPPLTEAQMDRAVRLLEIPLSP